MKRWMLTAVTVVVALSLFNCSGHKGDVDVIPEMKEFMDAIGSKPKLEAVIDTYGTEGVVPAAMEACDLEKPVITKAVTENGILYYTAEATVADCDRSENAVGTVRVFTMGWKDGKIVSFEWQGPKSGNVEY